MTITKPIRRDAVLHRDEVIVTLHPGNVIGFRVKRHKREHTITLSSVYTMAIEASLQADKKAKAEARKLKLAAR